MNRWTRKLHRWGAILTALPLLLVIATGILLQVKKQFAWVQPATMKGSSSAPTLDWEVVINKAISTPEADVQSWKDIRRIDLTPNKGVLKIICNNHWEIQLDAANGNVLSSCYRRSDWIEQLHDGSFFGEWSKLGIFLPSGIILGGLWFTGAWLWWLPIGMKLKKKKKVIEHSQPRNDGSPEK